ncbi:MAG: isochorismate synthase [Nocardioides sp.]
MTDGLVVRSARVPHDQVTDLLAMLPDADSPTAWVRRGDGLVGWGVAARIRTAGPTRFADAAKWWDDLVAAAVVTDTVDEPGSGLVGFGSFAFSDGSSDHPADTAQPGSVLVVPRVIVGRRGRSAWITTVGDVSPLPIPDSVRRPRSVAVRPGALDEGEWMDAVAAAVARINHGDLDKVVLARDVIATLADPLDVRAPLARLASAYPTCWTFHVDSMFGATPELLVRRERGLVTSRVLAGTIQRTGDDAHDLALAATLARSSKDLEEHEYAVRSVADALEPHCSSMNVPEAPYVLHLPNVMHLATDVTGVSRDQATALELAASLHPSAAVGGTPTAAAVALIDQLEQMDRDRYAGPVGWMDADGDGEWGIALRSATVLEGGTRVRLFAGCGIIADSDPSSELAESAAKLIPVLDALA